MLDPTGTTGCDTIHLYFVGKGWRDVAFDPTGTIGCDAFHLYFVGKGWRDGVLILGSFWGRGSAERCCVTRCAGLGL